MSLFSSLNVARLALSAHQTAIQTVGQNIANAGTEGYARQRVQLAPTPDDDLVYARVGTGVTVARIERLVDEHLENTLRDARSSLAGSTERNRIFSMAETILSDLDGGGLSGALAGFFEALGDLVNQPEDPTVRGLVVEQGRTLAETFHFLDARVRDLRGSLDDDFVQAVGDLNRHLTRIADLNQSIVLAEDGGISPGVANDLRTERDRVLGELSDLIPIKVLQHQDGSVQVVTGSEVLVLGSRARTLQLESRTDGDITLHQARFADNGQLLRPSGGLLGAALAGRDAVAVELREDLDTVARLLLTELNAVHAGGEGLERLQSLRATHAVTGVGLPLDQAGLPFPVESGSFRLQVVQEGNGARLTYEIPIEVDGTSAGLTLTELAERIQATVGAQHPAFSARVSTDGHLELSSSSNSLSFTLRDDNTGVVAALGLNGFFAGTSARDLEVSGHLVADPSLLSSGRGAGAGDNSVALELLALRDRAFDETGGKTLEDYYVAAIGRLGVRGAESRDLQRNQEAIVANLRNQRESISGVNIDEEAIHLIQLQRAYQGAARFLNIVDRLLETLINSV